MNEDNDNNYGSAIRNILLRADAAKIKHEPVQQEPGEPSQHRLFLKSWPDPCPIVLTEARAITLEQSQFDSAILFSKWEGYCIPAEGLSFFEVLSSGPGFPMKRLGLVEYRPFGANEDIPSERVGRPVNWTIKYRGENVSVELCAVCNPLINAARGGPAFSTHIDNRLRLCLRLTGLPQADPEHIQNASEELALAIFFHVDLTRRVTLRLSPRRSPRVSGLPFKTVVDEPRPDAPFKGLVDSDPTAFYMYGRSAGGLPLVKYLAMYQVLEYYFPTYAEQDRCRRLTHLLREPRFNPFSDKDITKAVKAIMGSGPSRGPSERLQLLAVLESCIAERELRDFIAKDEHVKASLAHKPGLSKHRLNFKNTEASAHSQVASRIYDIRCRIVHTKMGDEEGDESPPLLPYSAEANQMTGDLSLIQFLAQRVIAANMRAFP